MPPTPTESNKPLPQIYVSKQLGTRIRHTGLSTCFVVAASSLQNNCIFSYKYQLRGSCFARLQKTFLRVQIHLVFIFLSPKTHVLIHTILPNLCESFKQPKNTIDVQPFVKWTASSSSLQPYWTGIVPAATPTGKGFFQPRLQNPIPEGNSQSNCISL